MASITDFHKMLLSNPEVAKMIVPSAKNEVYMDVNGYGKLRHIIHEQTDSRASRCK